MAQAANLYALNREGADPGGHILPNLLRFAEVLRRVGLDAGPASVLDMVRATEHVHIGRRAEFYQAARSIFVHRRQDLPLFDEAFNVFWRKPNTARSGMDLRSMGEQRRFRKPQVSAGRDEPMDDALSLEGDADDDSVSRIDLTRTYSAREVLRQKDFAQFSGQEIAEARRTWEAQVAECRILHQSAVAGAADVQALGETEANHRGDLARFASDRDRRIERIRRGEN